MVVNSIVSGGGSTELVSGRDSVAYYTIIGSDGDNVVEHSPSSNTFQVAKNSLIVIEASARERPEISYGGFFVGQLGNGIIQTFVFFVTDDFEIDTYVIEV